MDKKMQEQLKGLRKWLLEHWGELNRQIFIKESEEEKKLSDKELKETCIKYAKNNFQGYKYINENIAREILVSGRGIGKFGSITKSRDQSLSLKELKKILQWAKKTYKTPDNKKRHTVDGFTYFEQSIEVNSKSYTVKMATKDTHGNQSSYYYHFLEEEPNKEKK